MRPAVFSCFLGSLLVQTHLASADDFEIRILSGSIQLGGEITLSLKDADKELPEGAICRLEIAEPFASHLEMTSSECTSLELQQNIEPILDDSGYAIPSTQVPYELVVTAADGAEVGRVSGIYPYNNQFSDLRVQIKDIRNPVSPGQSFDVSVLGAGQPIADSLSCRWNTYGPVSFEPTSQNACVGRITAQSANGRDGDMDVEIVNLTDMHAVGYAIAKIIVQ